MHCPADLPWVLPCPRNQDEESSLLGSIVFSVLRKDKNNLETLPYLVPPGLLPLVIASEVVGLLMQKTSIQANSYTDQCERQGLLWAIPFIAPAPWLGYT